MDSQELTQENQGSQTGNAISVQDMYSRQFDIIDFEKTTLYPITIVGAGHVGSTVALMLAKTGAFSTGNRLTIVDPDDVAAENMAMQFYKIQHAIKKDTKVSALKEELLEYCMFRSDIIDVPTMFNAETVSTDGIVVCSVDDMNARKEVLTACTKNPQCKLFIDTRTGAELVQLFVIDPQSSAQVEYYMDHWKPNEEMDQDPCTARGISWTTFGISSLVGMAIGAFWRGLKFPSMISFDMANRFFDQEYYNMINEPVEYTAESGKQTTMRVIKDEKVKFDLSLFKVLNNK